MTIRPGHRKTFPRSRIAETLLMFMRQRGGANATVNAAWVYAPLADFYELPEEDRRLSARDYYLDEVKTGLLAWHSEVNSAAKDLKKEGYLAVVPDPARSGKSIWRLTPDGAERADFWLKRMSDKTAALRTLPVNAELAWRATKDESKKLVLG